MTKLQATCNNNEALLKKIRTVKRQATEVLMEAKRMEDKVLESKNSKATEEQLVAMVPYAALEIAQDRFCEEKKEMQEAFQAEKESMREHFEKDKERWAQEKKRFAWILAVCFVAVLAFSCWFVSNYEMATYVQEGDGINNYAGNYSTQEEIEWAK